MISQPKSKGGKGLGKGGAKRHRTVRTVSSLPKLEVLFLVGLIFLVKVSNGMYINETRESVRSSGEALEILDGMCSELLCEALTVFDEAYCCEFGDGCCQKMSWVFWALLGGLGGVAYVACMIVLVVVLARYHHIGL